jgi:hypothetical protein
MDGIEIFISYAHEDERLRAELVKHLSTLRRDGVITLWHDHQILPGTEWEGEISTHLNTASIILPLISSNFLASDYCNEIEMKISLRQHGEGSAMVIPIILRDCDWGNTPFGRLNALPDDGVAVTNWPNQDNAFHNIVQGIRRVITNLKLSDHTNVSESTTVTSSPEMINKEYGIDDGNDKSVQGSKINLSDENRKEPLINFQNRDEELEELLINISPRAGNHFWVILSGPQMGKSWMLDKLKREFSKNQQLPWKVKSLDLRKQPYDHRFEAELLLADFFKDEFNVSHTQNLPAQIIDHIRESKAAWLCLLDSAELLESKASSHLRRYMCQIYNALQRDEYEAEARLAFVAGTRRPLAEWKGVSPKPRFNHRPLTQFKPQVIRETLVKVVRKEGRQFSDSWFDENVNRLYKVTEGLPALHVRYINWMQENGFQSLDLMESSDCFERLALPYVNKSLLTAECLIHSGGTNLERKTNILKNTLLKLSPYRRLTRSHLIKLYEEDIDFKNDMNRLNWTINHLWTAIRDTHLTEPNRKEIMRRVYRPIRRLLFRCQFPSASEQYVAHKSAAEFYENWWEDDHLSADIQSSLVLEYIWHFSEHLRLKNTPDAVNQIIRETERLLARFYPNHRFDTDQIVEHLEDQMTEDEELQECLDEIDQMLFDRLLSLLR